MLKDMSKVSRLSRISCGCKNLLLFLMLTNLTGLFTLVMTNGALRVRNRKPKWEHELNPPFRDGQFLHCIAPTVRNTSEQFKGFAFGLSRMKTVGNLEFLRSISERLEGKQAVLYNMPGPGQGGSIPAVSRAL